MSDVLLKVNNLKTWFNTRDGVATIVDGISFQVRRGETFALLGESGCGKSMTALSIMRLLPQQASSNFSGEVLLDGEDLMMLPEVAMRNVRGNRIAMIFQEPMTSLNPVLTVGNQIGEVLKRHKNMSGRAQRERIVELLDSVGIPAPESRIDEYPHQLSGGMKQRVMIAIALACEPDLLIADEPTTALDVTIQAQVLDLLKDLQKKTGMAVLMITHDLGVVSEMVDRVAVMYAGQIVERADRDSFFSKPEHPYSQKLFEALPSMKKRDQELAQIPGSVPSLAQEFTSCRFAPRCQYAWEACENNVPQWIAIDERKGVRCLLNDPAHADHVAVKHETVLEDHVASELESYTLLKTDDLKVHFPITKGLLKRTVGHVFAVDGISLNVQKGQTLALVGESGCGKTTLGKGVLQLTRPTAGTVEFDGTELTQLKGEALRQARRDFQIIFQDPFSSMNPRMMVGDIIEEGMLAQKLGGNREQRLQRVDELLVQVGLAPEHKFRYPHEFSGGQRQRVCIARALAVNPKLIVCDEPTSALDVSVQAQILNLLKKLQNELQLTYLFITHNLSVVAYLADEVAVMYLGRIVEQGKVEEILENPKHPYTQALLSAVPTVDDETKVETVKLEGDPPSPINPPSGCHFHPRCSQAKAECSQSYPEVTNMGDGHVVRCYLYS
jgi:peptide/nickel transport system ATP-binding protein